MPTEWRFLHGWSESELEARLDAYRRATTNFDIEAPKSAAAGWRTYATASTIAREAAGPPEPDGPFERAWEAVTRYEFSDPRIVVGHFDPREPLKGRTMLLELKALGFRFLSATRVGATREETAEHRTIRGYRYDTLEGHIESGWEWFLLTKSHRTGAIQFRIAAEWRPGDFPNAWSRIGFALLGRHYQRRWTRLSHARLRRIVRNDRPVPMPRARLLHEGESEPPNRETA